MVFRGQDEVFLRLLDFGLAFIDLDQSYILTYIILIVLEFQSANGFCGFKGTGLLVSPACGFGGFYRFGFGL